MDNSQLNDQQEIINLHEIYIKLVKKKKTLIKTVLISCVLSIVWIMPEPRTYTCTVTLAPEISSMSGGGAIGDIASSFGFDLGSMQSADAIYPTLYPDIMESTTFVTSLFDVRVKNIDGDIDTTYYKYLDKKQKTSIWKMPLGWVKKQISSITAEPEKAPSAAANNSSGVNTFFLSKRQNEIVEKIRGQVKCTVDKKTDVITITVTDQDRLICATMADSISSLLQDYIIDYRTKKARVDINYYDKLLSKAKHEYELALGKFSDYSDTHKLSTLESTSSRKSSLNNDVQTKLATVNALTAQLQQAKARLQERTPSFTTIQCATVPVKPTGPKRMLFVLGITLLAFIGSSLYILYFDKNKN